MNKEKLLQDYIFTAKYSRIKTDNKKETWEEAVERVMKMHSKQMNLLNVNMDEIQPYLNEVTEAYLDKKILGAQRALQWGGDQIFKHNFRLYNCLKDDTEFVTSEGVRSFKDFKDGDRIQVLTHENNWKSAIVKNYGKSYLNKIKITRNDAEYEIYATSNHRWIKTDMSITEDLKPLDALLRTPRYFEKFDYNSATPFEKLYWCYGMVYGDGTKVLYNDKHSYSMIRLCGDDKKFSTRFEEFGFKTSANLSLNGDFIAYTGTYLKTAPDPKKDSPELIRAFVAGYLQADGAKNSNKNAGSHYLSIQSSELDHIKFIRECFPIAGVYIVSEKDLTGQITNYGIRPFTISFRLTQGQGIAAHYFKVESIEKDVYYEDVWCLEVEDDHSFMLSNGLTTGNCSASHANRPAFFSELMYVLLSGAGVGYSVQKHHVNELPIVKEINSSLSQVYIVDDSIEGWATAIGTLVESYYYTNHKIEFDFSKIRKKGSLIAGEFKAPGYEPLKKALELIDGIFRIAMGRYLTPLEVHEIACIIADSVISGGVRRSALVSLFSIDDEDMMRCKTGNWFYKKPYLARSNNSAVILPNTPRSYFDKIFDSVKEYGEPGFAFLPDSEVVYNPCFEVGMYPHLLDKEGKRIGSGFAVCNLTEINGKAITSEDDFYKAARVAAIMGTIQASYTDFKYVGFETKHIVERDALIGVGITGMAESQEILFNPEYQQKAAEIVKITNVEVAKILGINSAVRTTVIKPSGTSSLLLGTSSGIHPFHYHRYIRNVQANTEEQSLHIMEDVNPNMVSRSVWSTTDKVIAFPIEKEEDSVLISEDLSAIALLDLVKSTYMNWIKPGTDLENPNQIGIPKNITHNVSNTITVQEDEWDEVREYIWNNKEFFSGISLIPASGDLNYYQAPYIKVLDEVELAEVYGPAAILAGGLNVDGIHAFGDLWTAVDTALGKGEDLRFNIDELLKTIKDHTNIEDEELWFSYMEDGLQLSDVNSIIAKIQDRLKKKKSWIDRFNKFAYKYFYGDIVVTGECLKRVSIFHHWNHLQFSKNVHWEDYKWKKELKEAGSDIATACSGGSCEIKF